MKGKKNKKTDATCVSSIAHNPLTKNKTQKNMKQRKNKIRKEWPRSAEGIPDETR